MLGISRKIVRKHPEVLTLLLAETGLLILAVDLFNFILVLIAIDFSSWVVLPWAFFDKVNVPEKKQEMRWMKEAQGLLFVSGIFFMAGVLTNLGIQAVTSADFTLYYTLPIIQFLVVAFGFIMMFGGLYEGFRLVNSVSALSNEEERGLFRLIMLPVLTFNLLLTFFQISYVGVYILFTVNSLEVWTYFVLLVVSLVGTFLAIGWLQYLFASTKKGNWKARWVVSF